MHVKFSPIVAVLALAVSGSAHAQAADASSDTVPVTAWQGFYVGGSVGAGVSHASARTATTFDLNGYFADSSVPPIVAAGNQRRHATDFIGGVNAGYDIRAGRAVLGVVADVAYMSSNEQMRSGADYPCCAPAGFIIAQSVKTDWLATARVRVGYAVSDKAMLYATGGYAGVQARYTARFTDTFDAALESSTRSKFMSGWTIGGGGDVSLGGKWSLRPEYLHAEFGTLTAPAQSLTTTTQPFPTTIFTHHAKLNLDIVRIGVNYRF